MRDKSVSSEAACQEEERSVAALRQAPGRFAGAVTGTDVDALGRPIPGPWYRAKAPHRFVETRVGRMLRSRGNFAATAAHVAANEAPVPIVLIRRILATAARSRAKSAIQDHQRRALTKPADRRHFCRT